MAKKKHVLSLERQTGMLPGGAISTRIVCECGFVGVWMVPFLPDEDSEDVPIDEAAKPMMEWLRANGHPEEA